MALIWALVQIMEGSTCSFLASKSRQFRSSLTRFATMAGTTGGVLRGYFGKSFGGF